MKKYSRKAPHLVRKNRILILCGGQTEEIYFRSFKEQHKKGLENVTVRITACKYSNPLSIVNEAISIKSSYDEIWCVFDKDDFIDFDDAINEAKKHSNINCAFSNEAIEYWFVLHFSDTYGSVSRKKLNEMIGKQFHLRYDKSRLIVEQVCSKLEAIEKAEERAQKGCEYHELNSGKRYSNWRSCTSVYKLTKRLRKWNDAE